MSRCASREEDGIRFGVVDNKVNDSMSIVKLQRVGRSLALVAMDTSFYTSNLVMRDEGSQLYWLMTCSDLNTSRQIRKP
jgi:hypothetical protein